VRAATPAARPAGSEPTGPESTGGDPPVFVVIPVRDQLAHTRCIIEQLVEQGGYERIFIYDNGSALPTLAYLNDCHGVDGIEVVPAVGWRLYAMWQDGVRRCRARAADCDVAILNNDLRLGPRFLESLSRSLRSDAAPWAISPRYDDWPDQGIEYVSGTFKDRGLAGFAYMVRSEAFDHVAFDLGFHWWFGDDDLVAQIEMHGHKVAVTGDTWVEHVDGGSQTLRHQPGILPELAADWDRMVAKWGHS
jgi:hypothetical protein